VSVDSLLFDGCFVSDASVERAFRSLRARTSATSKRLQFFRPRPRLAHRHVLMARPRGESAASDERATVGLIAQSRNGDAAAMEALIRYYQPRIAGFVFACLGDGQAVDDMCQTIFYKMLLGLPRLDDEGKFESWLFRIARNACVDYLRRRRLRRIFVPWKSGDDQLAAAEPMAEPVPESTPERRIDTFRRALMTLPKKQRELVALLQDKRLSYEQLAAITNTSVSSVKSRLFRARRQLRKTMRDDR
jgi:RNA polymerase sigma-70 factor (ECF subfamily)